MESPLLFAGSCEIHNVIHSMTKNNELAMENRHQLCSVYGEELMSVQMVSLLMNNVYWRDGKHSQSWVQWPTINYMPSWCHCCLTSLTLTNGPCLMKSWLYGHHILKLADPLSTTYWLKTFFQLSKLCAQWLLSLLSDAYKQLHNPSCSCLKMRVQLCLQELDHWWRNMDSPFNSQKQAPEYGIAK